MTKPDLQPQFLAPADLAGKLRPQLAAAELAVLNAWAEAEDAQLVLGTATRRLEILTALWPPEIPIDATPEDSRPAA